MDYTIAGFENRGSAQTPFGRLYLQTPSKEIVGDLGVGQTRDSNNPLEIWVSNRTPNDVSEETIRCAKDWLESKFPHLVQAKK